MKRLVQQWMRGRYGPDYLGWALALPGAVGLLASLLFRIFWLAAAFAFPIFIEGFRFFSRDLAARRRENDRYVTVVWPIKTKIGRIIKRMFRKKKKMAINYGEKPWKKI